MKLLLTLLALATIGNIPTEERVVDRDECIDIQQCPAFNPYLRVTDVAVGGVKWLISNQHHACVVSDADYVRVAPESMFTCEWRFKRQ